MSSAVLKFVFNGKESIILSNRDDKMNDIFIRFSQKNNNLDIHRLSFLYNGNEINGEIALKEMNNINDNVTINVVEKMADFNVNLNFVYNQNQLLI